MASMGSTEPMLLKRASITPRPDGHIVCVAFSEVPLPAVRNYEGHGRRFEG